MVEKEEMFRCFLGYAQGRSECRLKFLESVIEGIQRGSCTIDEVSCDLCVNRLFNGVEQLIRYGNVIHMTEISGLQEKGDVNQQLLECKTAAGDILENGSDHRHTPYDFCAEGYEQGQGKTQERNAIGTTSKSGDLSGWKAIRVEKIA